MARDVSDFDVCTIVARNYLPAARVLAESFLEHHPGGHVRVLVVDDLAAEVDASAEPFDVLHPEDLDLARDEFLRMAMLYDVTELCTAVKPWLLRLLLDCGAGTVLYLDPDIEVFATLQPLAAAASEHGIVIVPHAESAIPRDGREPSDETIMQAGAYNLGFIGVTDAARPLLAWWEERLARECYRNVKRAHFVDQRFVDLVPGLFPTAIVRDRVYNVAYWNLHTREVTKRGDVFEIDGRPLAFFHYSGYSAARPHILFSYHHDEDHAPRVLLSEHPVVAELCVRYLEKLAVAGAGDDLPAYAYDHLADGSRIDVRTRRIYRDELERAEAGEGEQPVNAFLDGDDAFLAWLREPVYPPVAPQVGRYLADIWGEDPNLQHEFPELEPETADVYLEWCMGPAAANLPSHVLPTDAELAARRGARRRARPTGPRKSGVNLVGYHGAVLGLGEVARSLVASLHEAGVDVAAVGNPMTLSRQLGDVECVEPADAPYDVNVFVVNADMMPPLAGQLGPDFFAGRRNVGVWFWEVDRLAPRPYKALQVLDEVWVASEHSRAAVAAVAEKPVHVVPIAVPVLTASIGRDEVNAVIGIPDDRFVFLMALDLFSVGERKNAWALVEAYRDAFAANDGALLVVKVINGMRRADDLERLRLAAADRPDVVIVDDYLSREQYAGLMERADAYVSLHRAEGFGLTMAEAMALGKPVIATGYSGNMEFMDESVAYLVPYTLRDVGPEQDPYPPDAQWAEPDLERAGKLMREVFEQPARAAEVGARARVRIREQWSASAVAPRLAERLDALRARTDLRPTWREFFMRGWRPLLRGRVHRNYDSDWLPDGTPFDTSMQALYDHALRRSRAGRGRPAPDPDDAGTDAALAWLNKPFAPRLRPIVSRYLVQYWHDHPELHERFPAIETDRTRARAYVDWVREHWHDDTDVPRRLVPR